MATPLLNVHYWSLLYDWLEDDDEPYQTALAQPEFIDRAEQLWSWKALSRGIDFKSVAAELASLDMQSYLKKPRTAAVRELREELQRRAVLDGNSLVTPAFLLHLAASESGRYSVQFPIYDRRVWNAYVYLWGIRTPGERLYWAASLSPKHYADYCRGFATSCPADVDPRRYEQALFMFGGFIMDLAAGERPTRIETIDKVLSQQETAVRQTHANSGFTIVNLPRKGAG